jgi:sRNA-binding regulator protein Hfq
MSFEWGSRDWLRVLVITLVFYCLNGNKYVRLLKKFEGFSSFIAAEKTAQIIYHDVVGTLVISWSVKVRQNSSFGNRNDEKFLW